MGQHGKFPGATDVPRLPIEILNRIVAQLAGPKDTGTLSKLSLTGPIFSEIAARVLYRRVHLGPAYCDFVHPPDSSWVLTKNQYKWYRAVLELGKPHLIRNLRECVITRTNYWIVRKVILRACNLNLLYFGVAPYAAPANIVAEALFEQTYPNLKVLQFDNHTLRLDLEQLTSFLKRHPQLEIFQFTGSLKNGPSTSPASNELDKYTGNLEYFSVANRDFLKWILPRQPSLEYLEWYAQKEKAWSSSFTGSSAWESLAQIEFLKLGTRLLQWKRPSLILLAPFLKSLRILWVVEFGYAGMNDVLEYIGKIPSLRYVVFELCEFDDDDIREYIPRAFEESNVLKAVFVMNWPNRSSRKWMTSNFEESIEMRLGPEVSLFRLDNFFHFLQHGDWFKEMQSAIDSESGR